MEKKNIITGSILALLLAVIIYIIFNFKRREPKRVDIFSPNPEVRKAEKKVDSAKAAELTLEKERAVWNYRYEELEKSIIEIEKEHEKNKKTTENEKATVISDDAKQLNDFFSNYGEK